MWERLARNIGWSMGSLIFVALAGFATIFLNARALGADGLGVYVTVLSLSIMLELTAGLQCWQAIVALVAKGADEARIFGAAILMNLATCAAALCVGLVIAATFDFEGGWLVTLHLATLMIRIPEPASGILRRRDLYGYLAFVRAFAALFALVNAAVLFYFEADVGSYIVASAVVQVTATVMLYLRSLPACTPKFPTSDELREVVSFSMPTGASGAIGAMRAQGVILLLNIFAGPAAVGLYAVADRIAAVLQMVYRAGFEAVFREMADTDKPRQIALRIGLLGLTVGLSAVAASAIFGEMLIVFVAGEEFRAAALLLVLLALVACFPLATLGLRSWIIVNLGPKVMLMCNLFALVGIALGPILITRFGATGATFTQIAFELIWICAVALVILRRDRFSKRDTKMGET